MMGVVRKRKKNRRHTCTASYTAQCEFVPGKSVSRLQKNGAVKMIWINKLNEKRTRDVLYEKIEFCAYHDEIKVCSNNINRWHCIGYIFYLLP